MQPRLNTRPFSRLFSSFNAVLPKRITENNANSIWKARLDQVDPEVSQLIRNETQRQRESLVLIPSENFTSRAVMDALGSSMQNKYSEGYPGARYYGGNEFIDEAERLCQRRALEAFHLNNNQWGVNVQSLSGSPANMHVYSALLKPHDRIMGLDLPHGGHLSHGYQTATKKISAVSTYFETIGYRVDPITGIINYDKLQELASIFRPKLIIAGASAYPRLMDFKRMKEIADSINAYLMADISHWSGMMAAQVIPGPFEFADVVTTTTHKSLRGPRAAMIFYRQNMKPRYYDTGDSNIGDLINQAVFPGHQGGPHNHTISALAVALKQATSKDFTTYQQQVIDNCQALAKKLLGNGIKLVSGGTDTHLLLIDLSQHGVDGARVERVLELMNVAVNKNTIPGDKSALKPSGLRLGTPAMTTRGFENEHFEWTADVITEGISLTKTIQEQIKAKTISEFKQRATLEAFPILEMHRKSVIDYVSGSPFYDL